MRLGADAARREGAAWRASRRVRRPAGDGGQRRVRRGVELGQSPPAAPACRASASRRTIPRVGARSTTRPAYITATSSVRPATTPRSWVIRIIAMCRRRCSRASRSRICACTVTSSAVVGSSAISSRGSQDSAMAMATRWRIPPESWCGYCRSRCSGAGMPTDASSSTARRVGGGRSDAEMRVQRLDELRADGQHRVERAHRVLEHHGNRRAAQPAQARRATGAPDPAPRTSPARRAARAWAAIAGWRATAWSCRSPTRPPRPSVRPGASARSTPSTARSAPRGVGSSTETSSTESSGARHSAITAHRAADR